MERHSLTLLSIAGFAAACAVAAVVCYRRPSMAIALLIAADPFLFSQSVWRTTITLPKAVLAGVLLGLLARRADWRPLFSPQVRPLSIGALAIVAATALSAIPGEYIDAVARETLKAAEYALAFACCLVARRADPGDAPFRFALIGTTAVVVCLAIAQEWGGAPSAVSIGGHDIARIAGPLEGPNQLAGYLVLCTPVLFAMGVLGRDRIALAVACLASLGLILTLSRAGIASALTALLVLALLLRGVDAKRALAAVAGFAVLAIATLGALGGLSRLATVGEFNAPTGLATRAQLWSAAIELWKRSPWLGIGAGNFELQLQSVGLEGVRTHPNSAYLQALTEGGIPLLAAVAWTAFASVWIFARSGVRTAVVVGVTAASAGFALHQAFDSMSFNVKVGEMWWILLGTAAGTLSGGMRGAAPPATNTAA